MRAGGVSSDGGETARLSPASPPHERAGDGGGGMGAVASEKEQEEDVQEVRGRPGQRHGAEAKRRMHQTG